MGGNDLSGWDLSQQDLSQARIGCPIDCATWGNGLDLTGANLSRSDVNIQTANVKLSGANVENAGIFLATQAGMSASVALTNETVFNQWTIFANGYGLEGRNQLDLGEIGLTFVQSQIGDFDLSSNLDAVDLDGLAAVVRNDWSNPVAHAGNWPKPAIADPLFDINEDPVIDTEDYEVWVTDRKRTWFGVNDLDGEFDSNDPVDVFTVGKYETGQQVGWAEGDWNADGVFGSADLVIAFQNVMLQKGGWG